MLCPSQLVFKWFALLLVCLLLCMAYQLFQLPVVGETCSPSFGCPVGMCMGMRSRVGKKVIIIKYPSEYLSTLVSSVTYG